jgi:hypothetical protein
MGLLLFIIITPPIINLIQFKQSTFTFDGQTYTLSTTIEEFQKKKYFEIGGHGLKITEPYANLELLINYFIRKKATTILFQSETVV